MKKKGPMLPFFFSKKHRETDYREWRVNATPSLKDANHVKLDKHSLTSRLWP